MDGSQIRTMEKRDSVLPLLRLDYLKIKVENGKRYSLRYVTETIDLSVLTNTATPIYLLDKTSLCMQKQKTER